MENEKVEELLREAKTRIYVDEELKSNLRKSMFKKRRPRWRMPVISAAIAAIFLFSFILNNKYTKHVHAEDLMITNAISFFDIGSGAITASTSQGGNLYLAIRDQGIFLYTNNGLVKLSDLEADWISIDSQGHNLLFSNKGQITQLSLQTSIQTRVMKGSSTIRYQQPVWKDEDEIYATKENKNNNQIVLLSLQTKKEKVIADGSSPSLSKEKSLLVFENNGTIMMENLKNNKVVTVTEGEQPSISEDGRYISFIKEEKNVENLWIIDTDLQTKKKVTANSPIESGQLGMYDYSFPIWNSGTYQLYVMKKRNGDEMGNIQIMKVELGTEKLTAEHTVERFLQALVVRDDDYAKSLMEDPPEFLTYSNPHFIGYRILDAENKENNMYIKAEVYRADTARPYYSVSQYEFKLKKEKNRYIIRHSSELNMKEVTAPDLRNLVLIKDHTQKKLFSLEDVPKQSMKNDNARLGSLVWDQQNNQIIFSVQEMSDGTNQAAVTLWTYNRKSNTYSILDHISSLNDQKNIGITGMSISPTHQYIAVDMYTENQPSESYVLLYDLVKRKQIAKLDHSHSVFWQGESLIIQKEKETQSMLYYVDPKTGKTIVK